MNNFCKYVMLLQFLQLQPNMLSKVLTVLKDPKQMAMAVSGILMLGYYVFYARKEILGDSKPKNQHKLELNVHDLLEEQTPANIIKIVLTESSKQHSDLQFRSEITSRLKAELIRRNLTTLINCSPLKILKSGCECLLESLTNVDEQDEQEWISYYQNSLRCELVIEKTIVDIQSIKKEQKPVYILCDNNNMDIKINADESAWNKFLQQKNISEEQLRDKYQIVFHLRFPQGADESEDKENLAIKKVWNGFSNYNEIIYDNDHSFEENIDIAMNKIMIAMKGFLPVEKQ